MGLLTEDSSLFNTVSKPINFLFDPYFDSVLNRLQRQRNKKLLNRLKKGKTLNFGLIQPRGILTGALNSLGNQLFTHGLQSAFMRYQQEQAQTISDLSNRIKPQALNFQQNVPSTEEVANQTIPNLPNNTNPKPDLLTNPDPNRNTLSILGLFN